MPKVKIGRTTDRQKNFSTPTTSETKCPYFYERFIGWGVMNEKRAVCGLVTIGTIDCDYRHATTDGTLLCLRYWYGPEYEPVYLLDPVYVQKQDIDGNFLYYEADGITETIVITNKQVMVDLTSYLPVPYIENTKVMDPTTMIATSPHPEFYSQQYQDTHGKVFGINGNELGWFYNV